MTSVRYQLLLVEDDPADRMLFEAVLSDLPQQQFIITVVETLADAERHLETQAVDLVVIDLHLPDSDGSETFTRIQPHCAQLPVVVLSSLDDEAFADSAVRAGAQTYLIKGEADGRLLARLLLHAIERHRIQRLLAESEEGFRWLVDGLADGLILLDSAGKALLVNHAARQMFPPKVDIEAVARRLLTVGQGDEIVLDGAQARYAEVRSSMLRWQGQSVRAISLRDVSERRRNEELRGRIRVERERARQLHDMSAMKSEMITRMTHELRTPMTPLRSILGALSAGVPGPLNEEQQALIELLEQSVERLSRFATQVMTTASLESNVEPVPPQRVVLPGAIQSTVELMRLSTPDALTIVVDTATEVTAWICPDDLSQVVMNLVTNAQMHNDGDVHVSVSAEPHADMVLLTVEDDGHGIPAAARDAVFERFVQLNRRIGPGYQGSGLGLAICKTLIDRAGGHIEVGESALGGAAFKIYLPRPPLDV